MDNLFQDHNTDFIVKFPDWDPQGNPKSNISKHNRIKMLSSLDGKRRLLVKETSSDLPQAHLWYSTQEVIKSLKLFIDGGSEFAGSLTYR